MTFMEVPATPLLVEADPNVHLTTLGRYVVSGYRSVMAGSQYSGHLESMLGYRMKSSRMHLAKLNPEQSEVFDTICDASVPEALREIKTTEGADTSWHAWLGEKASDEQLLEFLQWHVAAIESQQQDPGIQEEVAIQRAQHKDGVRRGLSEGWLHSGAIEAIDRVDEVEVYIGDVFSTKLEEQLAYHKIGSNEVVVGCATPIAVSGSHEDTRSIIRRVARHEFNHAVLGRLGSRWLNEAITEHIAQVFQTGEVEKLNPADRDSDKPSFYEAERYLLDDILRNGAEVIPVKLATLAYSEEPSKSHEAFDEYKAAIDRSWHHMTPAGESAYHMLNRYINGLETRNRMVGLSASKSATKAVMNARRDLEFQPEVVFSGNADARQLISGSS